MILDTQALINWNSIRENEHNIAMRNNIRENNKRIEHECKVVDLVLLDKKHRKLDDPCEGPCEIIQVYSNGTTTLQKERTETTVNIRQIHPFWRRRCNDAGSEPEPFVF